MKRKTAAAVSMLLVLAWLLCACGALKDAQALTAYDMSGDSIPSVNAIVGERKVEGVSTSTKNGVATKEYTYASDTVTADLIAYLEELLGDYGFMAISDFDLNSIPGTGQIATQSKDSGQIIIIRVDYTQKGYTISLSKGEGTLTAK